MSILRQFRLDGQVALITGGSRGLGRSMAQGLAEAGAKVVLTSRSQEVCDEAAAAIQDSTGETCLPLAADVTSEGEVAWLFEQVMERFDRLDVLLNSAGVNLRHPIERFPVADFEQVVDVNLRGTWLCCRAAAPIMLARGQGSVINVGSSLSLVGLAERSAYCASKAAVVGLTRTLALEWAPDGVRCNALCPGPFLTEMNRVLLSQPERVEALIGQTAFKRWGELEEIRGAALFLASDASSYMTGATLVVDGGWTAG